MMLVATNKLRRAVLDLRAAGTAQYKIAAAAGYPHPTILSHTLNGSYPVRRTDKRVLRLCEIVGVAFDQAFELVDRTL